MSYTIKLADYTSEQLTTIVKALTVIEKPGFAQVQKGAPATVLRCYIRTDSTEVKIPLGYYRENLGSEFKSGLADAPIGFLGELRAVQLTACAEALAKLNKTGVVNLEMYPGFGKTIIATWLWSCSDTPVVALVPNKSLLESWKNTFKTFFGIEAQLVTAELKPAKIDPTARAYICMEQQTAKLPARVINDATVIVDESHLWCTDRRIKTIMGFQPRFLISCSATLFTKSGSHRCMRLLAGEGGVERKPCKPHKFIRLITGFGYETPRNLEGEVNFGGLIGNICADTDRNAFVIDVIDKCLAAGHKVIVLSRLATHIETLQKLFVGEVSGAVKSDTFFRSKRSYTEGSVLFGTMSKIGTGFDEAQTLGDKFSGVKSNVIIFTNTIESWTTYEQSKGRVMRADNPYVVMLEDDNKLTLKHIDKHRGYRRDTAATESTCYIAGLAEQLA